jgi:hypothetical protein
MKNKQDLSEESIGRRTINGLSNYVGIALAIGLCCQVFYYTLTFQPKENKSHIEMEFMNKVGGWGNYAIDKYHTLYLPANKTDGSMDTAKLETLKVKYREIYDGRKRHYEESSHSLSKIINALGVCCLISILALYYEEKESISIAGVQLPFKAVFLILPVLMLYLWLSFGFTYFSALDSRQICFVAGVKYESLNDKISSNKQCISHDFSIIYNLEDRGIIDGSVNYFNGFYSDKVYNYFYKDQDSINHKKLCDTADLKMGENLIIPYEKDGPHKVVVISLFLIFGTLLGLSNGFIITLLIRFQNLKTTNTLYSKVLVLLVFVLLCLSFLGFCWSKPYTLSFMGYIWLITAIVLYIYIVRLKKVQ